MQLYTLLRQEKQSPLSECLECCLNLKTNSISCHWTHFHRDEIPCPRSHGLPGREEERSQIWKKYLPTMQEALVYTEEKIKLVSNDPSKPKTRLGANRPMFFFFKTWSQCFLMSLNLGCSCCSRCWRRPSVRNTAGWSALKQSVVSSGVWGHSVSRERVCPGRRVWCDVESWQICLSLPWGCYYTSLL